MRCLIKNIPSGTFGVGNRGLGFPLTDYCSTIPQPFVEDTNCYLVKEEDGFTEILTELENQIDVTCTNPEVGNCYIVLQEDRNIWLGQQENREDLIFCSEVLEELCQLVLQEDRTVCIAQQDGDCLMVEDCPEYCYLVDAADPNTWVVDHDGSYIFVLCS
jgi:hypothetical protein